MLGGTLANLRAAGRRHFFALPLLSMQKMRPNWQAFSFQSLRDFPRAARLQQHRRNCWELFGADFLIDCWSPSLLSRRVAASLATRVRVSGDGSAILLEVNPSPSLAMYGEGPESRNWHRRFKLFHALPCLTNCQERLCKTWSGLTPSVTFRQRGDCCR